ncbi:hypothetical protein FQN57_000412 [Myotisia sp. PD_48]|nr:hypothetical protein FQN57_000412 [Myotisia sp. PD_48]
MKISTIAATAVLTLLHATTIAAKDDKESKPPLGPIVDMGCYKSVNVLKDHGDDKFASRGQCQRLCYNITQPVMALTKGKDCYCGQKLPPDSEKVPDSECKTTCQGYDQEYCGGKKAWSVLLVGYEDEDDIEKATKEEDAESATTTNKPGATITQAGQTIVVTNGATETPKSSGPNKAGIAAGVVVGVVALAGIIGGVFFFMKYKKRREVVEEYRRNATISSFVSGGKGYSEGSAASDARLDPSIMSQRRQSNGSIADDQDFSRRILKVTNPDDRYY